MSTKNAKLHGFAFWFDVIFHTDNEVVTLSTSPLSKSTHWKQTVAFLPEALENSNELPELKEYDRFGCYVIMNQSDDNCRNYVIDIGVHFNGGEVSLPTKLDENSNRIKEEKQDEGNIYDSDEDDDDDYDDDDDDGEHEMPCDCKRIKCILIKASLERYENEKNSNVQI